MTNRLLARTFVPHGDYYPVSCLDPRYIKPSVRIDASHKVTIGKGCIISDEVLIYTHEHHHKTEKGTHLEQQDKLGILSSPLRIEDDVYIGARVIILCNCNVIEKGAVIAAGAVVTKDVPSYEVWGGNPARRISQRPEWFDKERA